MATKTESKSKNEVQLLDITNVKPSQLKELKGWETTQLKILTENPYVEIIDSKTYELAKQNRTALVSARTDLEKQDKTIASAFRSFRKKVGEETQRLINITKEAEEKQQSEVKRYEKEKEAEKEAEAKAEEERVQSIKDKIENVEEQLNLQIELLTLENIKESEEVFNDIVVSEGSEFDFQEFDPMFNEIVNLKTEEFDRKKEQIKLEEQQRQEREELRFSSIISEARADSLSIIESSKICDLETLVSSVKEVFLVNHKFGEHQETFDNLKQNMLKKAEQKVSELKTRQAEIIKQQEAEHALEQKNRVANIRELMLDLIEEITPENLESKTKKINDVLGQDPTKIKYAVEEFNKMKSRIEKELERKVNRVKEEHEAEKVKKAEKIKKRSGILRDLKMEENESEWTLKGFKINKEAVGTYDEIDFNNFVSELEKKIEQEKEQEKANKKRQSQLKPDKEVLTRWLTDIWDNVQSTAPANKILKHKDSKEFLKNALSEIDQQIDQLDEHLKNL